MHSWRFYLAAAIAVVAILIAGASAVEQYTLNRLLHDDAVATGRNWTEYLAETQPDLDRIAAGETPSVESLAKLEEIKTVGQIFLYKVYDADGRPRFVSDSRPGGGDDDEENLVRHNKEAAEAIEAGRPVVEVKEGSAAGWPPYYSEAYVPVKLDGRVAAVVETYVDQTAKRRQFMEALTGATVALGFLIAAAFGIPAAAWYRRGRAKQLAEARIDYLANYDVLTGLDNRTLLGRRLAQALSGLPARQQRLAVYCVDIHRFKDINDTLGFDAGDSLIQIVSHRLRSIVSETDIAARLGGDEFAIVRMNPRSITDAKVFGDRVIDALTAPVSLAGKETRISVRVGVAIAPDHGNDPGRLLRSADLALNKAKRSERVHCHIFVHDLDAELDQRLTLEHKIQGALVGDGFTLHFQPQFATDRKLTGFEALLRLPTGDGDYIPPATFIPLIEKSGLIDRVGAWVLGKACATAAVWPDHLSVAVNLSPAQFSVGNVGDAITRALNDSGLRPERLEIEITESLLMHDTEAVLAELAAIKELGVSIVMDDFGTGYSSLGYLWRFPFDKIKVDKSFMSALDAADANAEKIVRTIIGLGRSLKMRVMVEGVENERQADFVRALGCDEIQGFLFGHPAPITEVAGIILDDYRARTPLAERDESRRVAIG